MTFTFNHVSNVLSYKRCCVVTPYALPNFKPLLSRTEISTHQIYAKGKYSYKVSLSLIVVVFRTDYVILLISH